MCPVLLQAFKSVFYRYRAQKKLIDSYKLCEEGAKLQLQKGQLNCGVELALLLLEVCCLLSTCLYGLDGRAAGGTSRRHHHSEPVACPVIRPTQLTRSPAAGRTWSAFS